MIRTITILLVLLLATTTITYADDSNNNNNNVLHPKYLHNTNEWKVLSSTTTASTTNMILPQHMKQPYKFRLSLKQRNMKFLKEIALERSNPKHEKYGKYLTQKEIDDLTLPNNDDIRIVQTFIEKESLNKCNVNVLKEILEVTCDTGYVVENLFKTKLYLLQNMKKTTQILLRAQDFYLPKYIDVLVQSIYGLHGLPLPPRKQQMQKNEKKQQAPPAQPASVTPSVIEQVYNIKDAKVSGDSKNRQAVAEFQGQTMKDSDLTQFFKTYVPKAAPGDDKVYKFVGDPGEGNPGVEASLDIQYIMGVVSRCIYIYI